MHGGGEPIEKRCGKPSWNSQRLALALLHLSQITLKEEVEERSNHGDSTKASDFLPRWHDRSFDDVRGNWKVRPATSQRAYCNMCYEAGGSVADRWKIA